MITPKPSALSIGISSLGLVAFISAGLYALVAGSSLDKSDDPYLLGLFLGQMQALGVLLYFLNNNKQRTWYRPGIWFLGYYTLIIIYSIFIDTTNGEGQGIGIFIIQGIVLSSPIVIIYMRYAVKYRWLIYSGFVTGLIYGAAFINMEMTRHPERWSGETRNWDRIEVVHLNPVTPKLNKATLAEVA